MYKDSIYIPFSVFRYINYTLFNPVKFRKLSGQTPGMYRSTSGS